MSIIGSNILAGASGQGGGYTIDRSVRLRSSASAYLSRTFGTPTNQKIGTFSFWLKRGSLGARRTLVSNDTGSVYGYWEFDSSDRLNFGDFFAGNWTSTSVYRDPSAWYHIVIALDSTAAVNADRIKVYVNNRQDITGSATITQNSNWYLLQNASAQLGAFTRISTYFDGYITEVNFIDGQALDPTSFGEFNADTGVWQPKKYTGTYGTNGFYLNFSDNTSTTTIGYDYSGNGNNWTANNISLTSGVTYDSMTDVPTLTSADAGNYAVLNPIGVPFANGTVTDGNLKFAGLTTTDKGVAATISISSGAFYWESTQLSNSGSSNCYAGVILTGASSDVNANRIYVRGDGIVLKYGTSLGTVFSTFTNNDVIGLAFDRANNTLAIYKNGTLGYTVTGLNNADHTPWVGGYTTTDTWAVNFGQRPFAYTPPTGFKALNTFNLPEPDIVDGSQYFDVSLWTGDGASSRSFTGWDFAPDFIWIKGRSGTPDHALIDSVRGTGAKVLESNLTDAENSYGLSVTSFDSGGFTGATGSINFSYANNNAGTYVGWGWKAGGTAVSNTDGSITSSVSANTTSGFSVVTWTGTGSNATVGHGLGVAPSLIINKPRNSADNWISWHTALGATGYIYLNLTNASNTASTVWNSTLPTSSVFSVGTSSNVNSSGQTMVSYCFAEVPGFSKFGSYTGNGSADGPFVFCGFRPAFVLTKRTDAVSQWNIWDTARNTYNTLGNILVASSSSAEDTVYLMDFLSNGFKPRVGAGYAMNDSGGTYIYAAFAENPMKFSLAR